LSTDDRIGFSGSPLGGQVVSFDPSRWSYQLKYCPSGSWRSICSSVPIVRSRRETSSSWPMIPSRSAATALHMYAPMFVVEVCTERDPSSPSTSAGSPLSSSVIATNEAHVVLA
jgi:hypothetical protein